MLEEDRVWVASAFQTKNRGVEGMARSKESQAGLANRKRKAVKYELELISRGKQLT